MEKIIPGYLVGFRFVHDLCKNEVYDFKETTLRISLS